MPDGERLLREFFSHHRCKFWGGVIGLAFSLTVIRFGIALALFICGAVLIGYLVGKHMDDEQENVAEVLQRLLPPARR